MPNLPHTPVSRDRRTVVRWLVALGIALAAGLLARSPTEGLGPQLPRLPRPPSSLPMLFWELGIGSITWYVMVLCLPLLVWGVRRVNMGRMGRFRAIALGVTCVLGLVTATALVQYLVTYHGMDGPSGSGYLMLVLRRNVLPWLALTGLVVAWEGRRRARASVLEGEQLRAKIAEQRLLTLTSQLQPHFLFNTLQGISTLIHRNPQAADEMLALLADLLRELLRHRDRATVPLEDELRYARSFLEISRLRFADRLTFAIDAPASVHRMAVPLLILQPLLENALTHGIGNRMEGGSVTVTVAQEGGRLVIAVTDDGPPADLAGKAHGIGLSNTRQRLEAAFGHDHRLVLEPGVTGGTVVRIDVPAVPFEGEAG